MAMVIELCGMLLVFVNTPAIMVSGMPKIHSMPPAIISPTPRLAIAFRARSKSKSSIYGLYHIYRLSTVAKTTDKTANNPKP